MHKIESEIPVEAAEDTLPKLKAAYLLHPAINLLIYIGCYLTLRLIKRGELSPDKSLYIYLGILALGWAIGGLLSGKFRVSREFSRLAVFKRYYVSFFITFGVVALTIISIDDISVSRITVVSSLFLALLTEMIIYYFINKPSSPAVLNRGILSPAIISIDFVLLFWVLYFYYLKRVLETGMNDTSYILLAAIYISWIISSLLTKHFQIIDPKTTLWRLFSQHIKAYLVLFSLTASTIFVLNIEPYLRNDLLLGIMIYSGWSFLMTMFIYSDKIPYKTDEVYGAFLHAFEIKESDAFPDTLTAKPKAKLNDHKPKDPLLLDKLKFCYLKEYPQLFQFIERRVDLGSVNFDNMLIIRSADPYNIQVLPNDSLELFVNLHDINDLRRINRYFITVNEKLCDGGFYVGNFEAIKNRYARYLKKYPYLLANIFYFFDFLWKRVAPKIPVAQRFYFLLTKGKDRAISLAEGLGRLYFCGFEVIDIKEIDNMIYFVARKVKKPSSEYYNSYSFLFKMKRFGLHGKPIFVYKLRTMHPYSEYIQEFVYKHNQLEIGGKFKNDFRITSWGAWLRKLWIDELPMIFNLLRGDLKIFGVRPLSKHYLNLYSEEFRNRRANYKPGLVPPYYVHLPKTLEEIVKSEQTYLDEYDKNPFLTDIRYFFKAAYNIIIKKSRSS